MQSAAKNTSTGPMMAFAGMNMAAQNGGFNTQGGLTWQPDRDSRGNPAMADQAQQASGGPAKMAPLSGWTCSCGQEGNTGNFCSNCGKKKPRRADPGPAAADRRIQAISVPTAERNARMPFGPVPADRENKAKLLRELRKTETVNAKLPWLPF